MRELCSLWPTRLLLCGLALVLSAVQVLRIPLDTYGVSDVITSLGSMEGAGAVTETNVQEALCRIFLTVNNGVAMPLFLILALCLLRYPLMRGTGARGRRRGRAGRARGGSPLPARPNSAVIVRALSWCCPMMLLNAAVIWLQPILDDFVKKKFFKVNAEWMPPFVYEVTGVDEHCPTDPTNPDAKQESKCEYCVFPVTVTALGFLLATVYIPVLILSFSDMSSKVSNVVLSRRLRRLFIVFITMMPLVLFSQAAIAAP